MRTPFSLSLTLSLVLFGAVGCEPSPSAPARQAAVAPPVPVVPAVPPAPPVAALDEVVPSAGAIDPCVLGEWRLLPEHALRLYQTILSQNAAPAEVASITGGATLSMNAAGNATSNLSNLTIAYQMQHPSGPPVQMALVLEGTTSARFSAADGSMAFTESTSHIRGRMKVKVAGTEREVPFDSGAGEMFGGTRNGVSRYRCEEERLIITNPLMNGVETIWVR